MNNAVFILDLCPTHNPMFDLRPLSGFIPNIYRQTELYLISNIIHNVPVHSSTVELSGKV